MSAIKTIAIPNNIQEWPTEALNSCTNLQAVTVYGPKGDNPNITLTTAHNLRSLTNLISIQLPSTLKNIGDGNSSSNGIFPKNNLQNACFDECAALERIGSHCFVGCSKLIFLNFSNCTALESIGALACYACKTLRSLDFSNCRSFKTVEHAAFYGCPNLIFLNFLDCKILTNMDGYVFYEGSRLTTIYLPSSIQTIGNQAFQGCSALKTVYWEAAEQPSGTDSSAFPPSVTHIYNCTLS